jgi:hypothetical protein
MPINPMTGMPQPYSQEEMLDAPLVVRMGGKLPATTAGIGFQAGRSARTIMAGGGFMDDAVRFGINKKARRYGAFRRGSMTLDAADLNSGEQFLRKTRGLRTLGEKEPIFYGARANTITLRPRALRRGSSLSMLSQDERTYTYAQGVRGLLSKSRTGPLGKLAEESGTTADEPLLGPGLFGAITAGRKMDILEAKAYAGNARALSKLGRSEVGITRLAGMNNPSILAKTHLPRTS